MEKKDYKIGVYLRTAKKDDNAIKRQKELNISYCKYKGYPNIVRIYEDNGSSGVTENRLAYKRLLKDVKKGQINAIVVSDFARLTRQPVYFYHKMNKYISKEKLIIICANNEVLDEGKTYTKIISDFALIIKKYSSGGVK